MKKIILSLGAVAAIAAPIATVVACGGDNSKKESGFQIDYKLEKIAKPTFAPSATGTTKEAKNDEYKITFSNIEKPFSDGELDRLSKIKKVSYADQVKLKKWEINYALALSSIIVKEKSKFITKVFINSNEWDFAGFISKWNKNHEDKFAVHNLYSYTIRDTSEDEGYESMEEADKLLNLDLSKEEKIRAFNIIDLVAGDLSSYVYETPENREKFKAYRTFPWDDTMPKK